MMYVAIDPGDRWCGMAILNVQDYVTRTDYAAQTVVLDTKEYARFHDLIDSLLPRVMMNEFSTLICEEYRQRPIGHQSFNSGQTLKIIGAMLYSASSSGLELNLVPAGDPDKDLPHLILGDYVDAWKKKWEKPSRKQWQHGRSAWRIMASYMLKEESGVLMKLRVKKLPKFEHIKSLTRLDCHDRPKGLISPLTHWTGK